MATNNSCNYTPTEYNVQTGGANGTLNNVAPGTSGYVLTSNGSSSQPSFQAASGGSVTLDGNTGSATGSTITVTTGASNANGTAAFSGSSATLTLNASDSNNNTGWGYQALYTQSGTGATAFGAYAGYNNTTGKCDVFGYSAGTNNTTGGTVTAFGLNAALSNTTGSTTVFGYRAAEDNQVGILTAVGYYACHTTTGTENTAVGYQSMIDLTTGTNNTALGYQAGSNYAGSESSNICIGNAGVTSESNTIHIGVQGSSGGEQNKCFIAGITGATPTSADTPQVVLCDSTGNLAVISSSSSGYVLTSNGSSTPSFQAASASGAITTIDGDSGSMTPSSGVVTISGGTTGLTTSASSATMDLTGTLNLANGGTNADLTASDGGIFYSTASAGAILAGTATANQVLLSGSSTTPAWSTATYPATTTINDILYSSSNNVVGQITAADNGVLISGTTGIPSWLANSGTAGYVLTANSSTPPSWQAASGGSGIVTIDGNTGSVTGSTVTITTGSSNANGTAYFSGSSTTLTLTPDDSNSNTGWGHLALKSLSSGQGNVGIGDTAGYSISSGTNNILVGISAGYDLVSAGYNVAVGAYSLEHATTSYNVSIGNSALNSVTSGSGENTAIGYEALVDLGTGAANIALGYSAGSSYTGSETLNILIGNTGTAAESSVIRIGTSGSQTSCYIAGIEGVSVSNLNYVTINTSTGQLGSTGSISSMAWTDESSNFNAAAGNGYFVTATCTATLPSSPSQGNTIAFAVDSSSGILTITANTSQVIRVSKNASASAGTCASNEDGDSITLVYRSSDTTWIATSVIGTWTLT